MIFTAEADPSINFFLILWYKLGLRGPRSQEIEVQL